MARNLRFRELWVAAEPHFENSDNVPKGYPGGRRDNPANRKRERFRRIGPGSGMPAKHLQTLGFITAAPFTRKRAHGAALDPLAARIPDHIGPPAHAEPFVDWPVMKGFEILHRCGGRSAPLPARRERSRDAGSLMGFFEDRLRASSSFIPNQARPRQISSRESPARHGWGCRKARRTAETAAATHAVERTLHAVKLGYVPPHGTGKTRAAHGLLGMAQWSPG